MNSKHNLIIDRIRTAAANDSASMPVHARFGVQALDAGVGYSAFGQRMGPWLLDRYGRLCPGAFLAAADAALGCAVMSALAENRTVMSLTIHARFVRLQPGSANNFVIRGDAVHVGEESGSASGEIVDDTGRLFARMSIHSAFQTLAAPPRLAAAPEFGFDESLYDVGPVDDGSDDGLAPLAKARAGARLTGAADGEVRIGATWMPAMCNSKGDVQGGVLGLLAEQAISACLVRSTPALAASDNFELDITYLRPLGPERPDLEIVARAEHAGRRFALAHAQGRDNSGRLVLSASGSSYTG